MHKKELLFRKMLEGIDQEFSDYMLDKDYKLLELDGLTKINPFDFRKDYWSKPSEEVTINPNANLGNTGYKKNYCNLISEASAPINKLSCFSSLLCKNRRRNPGINNDSLWVITKISKI